MSQTEEIVNRVAKSPLITINLEDYYPAGERLLFDLKDWLFQEMILKEKDFRQQVKEHDWSQYEGKHIALTCSADAIVPSWAYMLITAKLEGYARTIIYGSLVELNKILFRNNLEAIDKKEFQGKKLVIKGCGDPKITEFAYVEITRILKPVASSIMYGEPCSTVPIYKEMRKKELSKN